MKRKIFIALVMLLVASLVGLYYSPAIMAANSADPGAVYTMTNDVAGNKIVIFNRDANGMLTPAGSISTQGLGSGPGPGVATGGLDPLGSQGSLMLSPNNQWLFACDAGSNDIAVFMVTTCGLQFMSKVASGGVMPVSIAAFDNTVFVLNAGGTCPSITGFKLSSAGTLTPIVNSTRFLGAGGYAQVGFDLAGQWLVVTDKTNNRILVFSVDVNGTPGASPAVSPSSGTTPFGFVFDEGDHLVIVEAGSNAVSSYSIMSNGALQPISRSIPDCQKAACWIANNGLGFAFTANPGSSSISAYRLTVTSGNVALINGVAGMGNSPIDLDATPDGAFLYALDPKNGGIDMFKISADGTLTNMGSAPAGLSIFAQGMAVR